LSVCLSVCLRVYPLQEPQSNLHQMFYACCLGRGSVHLEGVAVCYVLPVLRETPCLPIVGRCLAIVVNRSRRVPCATKPTGDASVFHADRAHCIQWTGSMSSLSGHSWWMVSYVLAQWSLSGQSLGVVVVRQTDVVLTCVYLGQRRRCRHSLGVV